MSPERDSVTSASASWTEPLRRRWEALPPARRQELDRVLRLLPGNLGRWRGLLQAGLTHVRLTTGDRRRVAIVGPPNAGKSTLYNRLILKKDDRAQVGAQPGTTHVAQEGDVGLFALVDTPGATASPSAETGADVEEPLARAMTAAHNADILVILFDATQPMGDLEKSLFDVLVGLGRPSLVALNKMDAVGEGRPKVHARAAQVLGLATEDIIPISARTGAGLERMLLEIARREPEIVAALGQALPAYRGTLARATINRAASTAAAIALTPLPMISFIPLVGVQTALVLSLAISSSIRSSPAPVRALIGRISSVARPRTWAARACTFGRASPTASILFKATRDGRPSPTSTSKRDFSRSPIGWVASNRITKTSALWAAAIARASGSSLSALVAAEGEAVAPGVSTSANNPTSPSWATRVVPGCAPTVARSSFLRIRRLYSVDLPAFGGPTMATRRRLPVVSRTCVSPACSSPRQRPRFPGSSRRTLSSSCRLAGGKASHLRRSGSVQLADAEAAESLS